MIQSTSNVSVTGFTIKNSGVDGNPATDANITHQYAGIGMVGVTGCTISNNTITNCSSGIGMLFSSSNTIQDNSISDCGAYGIILSYYLADTNSSTSNTITGNTITGSGLDGIYADINCNSNSFTNNTISNTGTGTVLAGMSDDPDGNGIYFWKSGSNTVTGNTITGNVNAGLELKSSCSNTITGNDINTNDIGVLIRSSGYASVRTAYPASPNDLKNNKIYGNTTYAIEVDSFFTLPPAFLTVMAARCRRPHADAVLGGAVRRPFLLRLFMSQTMTASSSTIRTILIATCRYKLQRCGRAEHRHNPAPARRSREAEFTFLQDVKRESRSWSSTSIGVRPETYRFMQTRTDQPPGVAADRDPDRPRQHGYDTHQKGVVPSSAAAQAARTSKALDGRRFVVGKDKATEVKQNLKYTGDTTSGTRTLTIKPTSAWKQLEILVAVKNGYRFQWRSKQIHFVSR